MVSEKSAYKIHSQYKYTVTSTVEPLSSRHHRDLVGVALHNWAVEQSLATFSDLSHADTGGAGQAEANEQQH